MFEHFIEIIGLKIKNSYSIFDPNQLKINLQINEN